MKRERNIVLYGFMGTGKTCVGIELARRLGMTFVDSDDEIVRRDGRAIAEIFDQEGEDHFRGLEREVAHALAVRGGLVIATGGGMVLSEECVRALGETGDAVCFTAGVDEILRRVGDDTQRPLLAGSDRRERIEKLLEEREPYYRRIPRQIPTDGLSVNDTADRVLEVLKR